MLAISGDRASLYLSSTGPRGLEARLKVESKTDTDVGIIQVEDLVWLAEQWIASADNWEFDPEVFNVTGILDRPTLEQRMELFL